MWAFLYTDQLVRPVKKKILTIGESWEIRLIPKAFRMESLSATKTLILYIGFHVVSYYFQRNKLSSLMLAAQGNYFFKATGGLFLRQ